MTKETRKYAGTGMVHFALSLSTNSLNGDFVSENTNTMLLADLF